MTTTDDLTEAIEALTYSDHRGLLQLSANKFDPLNSWFMRLAWAGIHSEEVPEFSPVGWQTWQVRQSLQLVGNLGKLCGRRLHRVQTLCRCLTDLLLEDMRERRAL